MARKVSRKTAGRVALVPAEIVERNIHLIRGEKVMLDADLARLYGVTTGALNQAVARNMPRFPIDFMFQLSADEHKGLISQSVTSKLRGGSRHLPYAFTEQGVAMLSSVLRSERAVDVNIAIMRTFVRLRQLVSSNAKLALRLDELEKKYDKNFQIVFDAIRQLMRIDESEKKRPPIGYHAHK